MEYGQRGLKEEDVEMEDGSGERPEKIRRM